MLDVKRVSPQVAPQKRDPKFPLKWIFLILLGCFGVIMAYEKFDDFVKRKSDGTYELQEERKDKLNDRVKRMRSEAEQYVLRASKNGFYECLHCPNGVFYLYKGEAWKYGVTTRGKFGRYKPQYLKRMGLIYEMQYSGSLQQAMELELIKIGQYPLLPENLARPDKPTGELIRYKLARPPGQATDS